jgi:predicted amidohydrolase YtcJ
MRAESRDAVRLKCVLEAIVASLVLATPAAIAAPVADLVLVGGRIYTVDSHRPWAEGVAVRNGRLIAVGANRTVQRFVGPATRVIELHGGLVTPGFIDAHVHFLDGALYLHNVALRDVTTMAEVEHRVAAYIEQHPGADWIQGEGFSYGYPDLPGGAFHRELIDAVSGSHAVLLDSGMAHAAWANSEALRRAGISRDTPNPKGGEIVRGADGEPTGWLKEDAAIKLVLDKIPPPPRAELKTALVGAVREANRLGITRVDSAGGDFGYLDLLEEIEREGQLSLRISIADWINAPGLSAEHLKQLEAARSKYHGDTLSCCVGKFIMDGVIDSHTAYMPGGYADEPSQTGIRMFEPDAYKRSVATLNRHGFQVYTHAIGDGAIKLALDAYEASQSSLRGAPPRNRIEHAEAPDPSDIPRFGRLHVIASMQPLMIYPRDEWKGMEGLWQTYAGDKFLPVAFALRSLLDAHAVVAFGTDWPIVQLNPILGLRNAVLRQSLDGQPPGGYVPAQRISIAEALSAYTRDAAFASRREHDEGSIELGKLADLVVFSRNFVEVPPVGMEATHVVMTLVGGKIVYQAPAAAP